MSDPLFLYYRRDTVTLQIRSKTSLLFAIENDQAVFSTSTNLTRPTLTLRAGDEKPAWRGLILSTDTGAKTINFETNLRTYRVGAYLRVELYTGVDYTGEKTEQNPGYTAAYDVPDGKSFRSVRVFQSATAVALQQILQQEIASLRTQLVTINEQLSARPEGEEAPPSPTSIVPLTPLIPARASSNLLPSFLLRSFAALAGFLGEEKRIAADDLVFTSAATSVNAPAQSFFERQARGLPSSPLPGKFDQLFRKFDPVRLAFYWISQAQRAPGEETEGPVPERDKFSALLYKYMRGGVLVWDVEHSVSPSFIYRVEADRTKELLVKGIDFEGSYRSVLPIALMEQKRFILQFDMVPTQVSFARSADSKTILAGKNDEVAALIEAAQYGFDWEGERLGNEMLYRVRNTAAMRWKGDKSMLFSGLYSSDTAELLSVATTGTLHGSKLVNVEAPVEDLELSPLVQWLYNSLGGLAKEAWVSGVYKREVHESLVTEFRRTIIDGIGERGLVYRKENGYLWVGPDGSCEGLCVRCAAMLNDDWNGEEDGALQEYPKKAFVIRKDVVERCLTSVSGVEAACGEHGLLVLMACVAAGSVSVEGRNNGYMKDKGEGKAVVMGDVAVPLRFAFVVVDEVVVCQSGYGMPVGKELVQTGGYSILSEYSSECQPEPVVAVEFQVKDVLAG